MVADLWLDQIEAIAAHVENFCKSANGIEPCQQINELTTCSSCRHGATIQTLRILAAEMMPCTAIYASWSWLDYNRLQCPPPASFAHGLTFPFPPSVALTMSKSWPRAGFTSHATPCPGFDVCCSPAPPQVTTQIKDWHDYLLPHLPARYCTPVLVWLVPSCIPTTLLTNTRYTVPVF